MNSSRVIGRIAIVLILVLMAQLRANAAVVSVKLTANALGLGSDNLNSGGTVDPDVPGLYTSPTTGEGSVLQVQVDGLAGPGSALNPLLVTITAQTRLDTVSGLPSSHDYQAGVLFISKEAADLPDGRKEGIGVRAFTVDGPTGLREIDSKSGLAKIEGSKHVSGGTGPTSYDSGDPNGPPHVDEAVYFDFNPAWIVNAQSVEVLLSEFDPTDIIDLHIERTSAADIDLMFLQTTNTAIFEEIGDKLWKLKFAGLPQLGPADLVERFSIAADDNKPGDPHDTAEHFFVTGLKVDAVPEPATMSLMVIGLCILRLRRR